MHRHVHLLLVVRLESSIHLQGLRRGLGIHDVNGQRGRSSQEVCKRNQAATLFPTVMAVPSWYCFLA